MLGGEGQKKVKGIIWQEMKKWKDQWRRWQGSDRIRKLAARTLDHLCMFWLTREP